MNVTCIVCTIRDLNFNWLARELHSKVSWIISAGSNISRVPNLLRLYLTQYCILSPEILTGQQEHKNVQEFVSISCHDAFVVDQEAFKHGE